MRFFLLKSPRNSLKYFFNHIIFYSFSFEFLLIIINFLLNKFSLIKTSSKTPFLINTASNLLHNSMPPLHRKRSHLLKERLSTHNTFRIAPLEGSCQRSDCGAAFAERRGCHPPISTQSTFPNVRPTVAHAQHLRSLIKKKRTTLVIRFKYVHIQLFNVNLFTGKNFIHSSCGAHLTAH